MPLTLAQTKCWEFGDWDHCGSGRLAISERAFLFEGLWFLFLNYAILKFWIEISISCKIVQKNCPSWASTRNVPVMIPKDRYFYILKPYIYIDYNTLMSVTFMMIHRPTADGSIYMHAYAWHAGRHMGDVDIP